MAKPNWKAIGTIGGMVTVVIAIVGIAWASGSKVTAVEKDIETVQGNATEDRTAIANVAKLVTSLDKELEDNYKELKQDTNDAKLRDERTATQYTQILSHMQQQTANDEREAKAREQMQIDITKVQVKVETLIKGE